MWAWRTRPTRPTTRVITSSASTSSLQVCLITTRSASPPSCSATFCRIPAWSSDGDSRDPGGRPASTCALAIARRIAPAPSGKRCAIRSSEARWGVGTLPASPAGRGGKPPPGSSPAPAAPPPPPAEAPPRGIELCAAVTAASAGERTPQLAAGRDIGDRPLDAHGRQLHADVGAAPARHQHHRPVALVQVLREHPHPRILAALGRHQLL